MIKPLGPRISQMRAAAGSGGTSRVSKSPIMAFTVMGYSINAEEIRQASAASNGACKANIGRVVNQGLPVVDIRVHV